MLPDSCPMSILFATPARPASCLDVPRHWCDIIIYAGIAAQCPWCLWTMHAQRVLTPQHIRIMHVVIWWAKWSISR